MAWREAELMRSFPGNTFHGRGRRILYRRTCSRLKTIRENAQRPKSKVQRLMRRTAKRKSKTPNTERRTPNIEHQMVNTATSWAASLRCPHACDENSDKFVRFSEARDQTWIAIHLLEARYEPEPPSGFAQLL